MIEGKQAMPGTSTYLFTIELRCIPFRAVSIGIAYDRTECRVYQMLKDLQGPNALDAYQFLFSSSQRCDFVVKKGAFLLFLLILNLKKIPVLIFN